MIYLHVGLLSVAFLLLLFLLFRLSYGQMDTRAAQAIALIGILAAVIALAAKP